MQLLERNDGKKWFLWTAHGKVGRDNQKKQVFSYFNRVDAIAAFEKKFTANTENKWTERDFFKAKLGKYTYFSAEKEKEKMRLAVENQAELMQLLKQAQIIGKEGGEMMENNDEIFELQKFIWNVNVYKHTLSDFSIDLEKVPLGVLQAEKVKKCNSILTSISRLLL